MSDFDKKKSQKTIDKITTKLFKCLEGQEMGPSVFSILYVLTSLMHHWGIPFSIMEDLIKKFHASLTEAIDKKPDDQS